MAGTPDPRLRYRPGDIVPIIDADDNRPAGYIRITQVRTEPLGAMTEADAREEGFLGIPHLFQRWWTRHIGPWQADREVVVLEFERTDEEIPTAPPLWFKPRFIRAILDGEKTQTRRDWLNDEPKNIGIQQGPADTHLTTNGAQT